MSVSWDAQNTTWPLERKVAGADKIQLYALYIIIEIVFVIAGSGGGPGRSLFQRSRLWI